MTGPNRDPSPEQPIDSVEWNGSRADIYAGIENEAAQGKVVLYDRSDFDTPIEGLRVISWVDTFKDLDDDFGLSLHADIRLDRSRNDLMDLYLKFMDTNNGYMPHQNKDDSLTIRLGGAGNVFTVAHSSGVKAAVYMSPSERVVKVTNDVFFTNDVTRKQELQVLPPTLDSMDTTELLKGFMTVVMRTVDYCSGLNDYNPRNAKLKRTYPVGKEIRPLQRQPGIGRTAIRGTRDEEILEKTQASLEELGVEIGEGSVSLNDVGGLHRVKAIFKDVVTSFNNPEVMAKWGANRPQGVLLYGEPGTGKTMLAQALSNELGAEIWSIQSTDIYEKWLGDSEQHIKNIFEQARKTDKPLVIFFDELESIVGITDDPSAGGADNARNAVAGIFKQEMNTLAQENPNILVVAATNDLDRIDPSLTRSGRFDFKIYVPMPDEEARQEIISGIVSKSMLRNEAEGFKIFADNLAVPEVAELTDGMSGADIAEIFRRLSLEKAMQEARSGSTSSPISQDEIKQAIQDFKQLG